MGRLIEGVWDCVYCDRKDIRASIKKCPTCGAPQDENTRFRLPDTDKFTYLTEEEAAQVKSTNPDWRCPACGHFNSASLGSCEHCNTMRSENDKNYYEVHNITDNVIKVNTEGKPEAPKPQANTNAANTSNTQKPAKKFSIGRFLVPVIVIAIMAFIISLFMPHNEKVTVKGFNWNRTVNIEELKTVNEDDWSLPSGARLHRTAQEIKSYNQVLDHYETKTVDKTRQVVDHYDTVVTGYRDLGNGLYEELTSEKAVYKTEHYKETVEEPVYRSVPEYATKYYYEIDKWIVVDKASAKGSNKNPYWPEAKLSSNQREGSRDETYSIDVVLSSKKKKKTYTLSYSDWDSLSIGDNIEIKVNNQGEIIKIMN